MFTHFPSSVSLIIVSLKPPPQQSSWLNHLGPFVFIERLFWVMSNEVWVPLENTVFRRIGATPNSKQANYDRPSPSTLDIPRTTVQNRLGLTTVAAIYENSCFSVKSSPCCFRSLVWDFLHLFDLLTGQQVFVLLRNHQWHSCSSLINVIKRVINIYFLQAMSIHTEG